MSFHFAMESSMMNEESGELLCHMTKLNLEEFSIPFSCFLSITSPSHSPLPMFNTGEIILQMIDSLPT